MLGDFKIVCTGKGQHPQREVVPLTRQPPGEGFLVGPAVPVEIDWSEWSMELGRTRTTAAGDRRRVEVKRVPKRGDATKPWLFPCTSCTERGRSVDDFAIQITDEKLRQIVAGYIARGLFEFDISYWRR